MSRNICCTKKLENIFAAFLKVNNYEVTLKPISLCTGKGPNGKESADQEIQ